MKRKIVVGISDTHAGHKLGLCNPNVILEDIENGDIKYFSPDLSETQKFMWETYLWGVEKITELAGRDEVVLIHNGDPTHGKAIFLQSMTSQISNQILIAEANLQPWYAKRNLKTARFAVGTGLHEFGEGTASVLIQKLLQEKYPKVNTGVVYHGLIDVDGFTIDFAHHGPGTGSRKWLEGNELRLYLRSIMMSEIMEGRTPPKLVLRGHYHVYRREFLELKARGEYYGSTAIIMPGFTFKDDYTRRATKSEHKQGIGMLAFEILDGELYKIHPFIKTVDIRTREIL